MNDPTDHDVDWTTILEMARIDPTINAILRTFMGESREKQLVRMVCALKLQYERVNEILTQALIYNPHPNYSIGSGPSNMRIDMNDLCMSTAPASIAAQVPPDRDGMIRTPWCHLQKGHNGPHICGDLKWDKQQDTTDPE